MWCTLRMCSPDFELRNEVLGNGAWNKKIYSDRNQYNYKEHYRQLHFPW